MKKEVTEGEMVPKWYGIAWRDYYKCSTTCYPLGIHWIARLIYHIRFLLKCGNPSWLEERDRKISEKAYSKGVGFKAEFEDLGAYTIYKKE